MNFKPLYDRVAIRPIGQNEKTAGGIIIPDTAKERPTKGEVLALGQGARSENGEIHPLTVKVGDMIIYGKYSGTEFRVGNEDIIIMKESDILGIFE